MRLPGVAAAPGACRRLSGAYRGTFSNFAPMGVTVNGEPAGAIVAVTKLTEDAYRLSPLFASLSPWMTILDGYGNAP
ncbi:MAG: hypothetical protein K2X45_10570 [Phreatobacter sp.]|nr:hypothetical protein [Phreatobacter sp.]